MDAFLLPTRAGALGKGQCQAEEQGPHCSLIKRPLYTLFLSSKRRKLENFHHWLSLIIPPPSSTEDEGRHEE